MTIIKPDRLSEIEQAATGATVNTNEFEGEIREVVRRDISLFRRARPETPENAADNIGSLIHRVSSGSVAEIERVIAELSSVKDTLLREGERVQREIAGYATLSQAAMTSMKIIGDSLSQWNSQPQRAAARQAVSERSPPPAA